MCSAIEREEVIRLCRESEEEVRRSREYIKDFQAAMSRLNPEPSLMLEALQEAHRVLERSGQN
jgi:hypothetical protein